MPVSRLAGVTLLRWHDPCTYGCDRQFLLYANPNRIIWFSVVFPGVWSFPASVFLCWSGAVKRHLIR